MAVTIFSEPEKSLLRVDGDVQGTLPIPAHPPKLASDGEVLVYPYYIALSDGSLIQASNHDDPEFYVVVEGAGSLRVGCEGRSLSVDWTIEWISVASDRAAQLAHKRPASLPLFDGLVA
jgi:hypothetical protein